jgi:hypothetical protein
MMTSARSRPIAEGSQIMRHAAIALGLVLVGYVLGSLRSPAQADDSGKIVDALRELVRVEERQLDALKSISERLRSSR